MYFNVQAEGVVEGALRHVEEVGHGAQPPYLEEEAWHSRLVVWR